MSVCLRMAVSYSGIVGSIVNRGLIDEESFLECSGERWMIGERMKVMAPGGFRKRFRNARGGIPSLFPC